MLLQDMTMKEFKGYLRRTKTLIVPYGSIEAHGVHLPLATDTMIIWEVVRRVAKRVRVFVAPPIYYGVCTSTGNHPGTIGITPETLRRLTMDIVRDGFRKGLRNFILVSGHGGGLHTYAIKEAGERLVEEIDGIQVASLAIYEILPGKARDIAETENDSHAGELETSCILHIEPGLVKGRAKEEYPALPKPIIVRDKERYWKGAVWGNPEKADPGKGAELLDIMVDSLAGLVRKIEGL